MKSLRSFLLLTLTALGLLTACEPDPIDLELPAHEPKLVIASGMAAVRDTTFGISDSSLVVLVSRSVSALSGVGNGADSAAVGGQMVEHARVELSGAGRTWPLIPLGDGVYSLPNPPLVPGAAYTLTVADSATGLSCAATTTYLPRMRFDYVTPTVERGATDTTVTLAYQLTARPASDFYMVQYTTQDGLQARGGPGAPPTPGALLGSLQADLRLLTTNDFRDGRYTLRERIRVSGQDTLLLSVAQISEDYYRFLQAYRRAGKFFNQVTGEPINFPSNVRGGYGFFGLHTLHAQLLDLNQY